MDSVVTEDQRLAYAGMYILKKLDLTQKEGGEVIGVLDPQQAAIEPVLDQLTMDGLIEIHRKKQRYQITKAGYEHIRTLIDEAESYIEEFDDEEVEDMVAALEARNCDVFRARFLWGWYKGEFDDLVLFQRRRGFSEVEPHWQNLIVEDAFYENLALDFE